MKKVIIPLIVISGIITAQFRQPNAADLQIDINKLSVLGSVLYVAAHPDDENTALMSYFAKGKLLRTAYLSITRGEGGQNLVGSEQGAELGLIRTQELLAARRVDGAEQYFTRAIDFGYSKSSEEALRLWNKDSALQDVVQVIRAFRPDIIITRFSPTQGGHGHHLASAILAEEAFKISGDSTVFPEQLKFVKPWKAKRLLFNHFRFGGNNPNPQQIPTFKIDVGEYNPLLGKSYTELAGISRTMHKSQAMGSPQNKGTSVNEFVIIGGDSATYDLFDDIDMTWNRVPGGKKIFRMAADLKKKFSPSAPEKSLSALLRLFTELQTIKTEPFVIEKIRDVESAIRACAGLSIDARGDHPLYSRNDSINVRVSIVNRSSANIAVTSLISSPLQLNKNIRWDAVHNVPLQIPIAALIRRDEPFSQPYWLAENHQGFRYNVSNPALIGTAENAKQLTIALSMLIDEVPITFTVPIQFVRVDDLDGEVYRDCEIVPPVSLQLDEPNIVWNNSPSKKIVVRLRAFQNGVNGSVLLRSSAGWILSPAKSFSLLKKGNETEIEFIILRDTVSSSGVISAEAVIDGVPYRSTVKQIVHSHIPTQTLLVNASAHSLMFDLNVKGSTVGYIMGAGDDLPKALEQMGYSVHLINDAELMSGSYERFDAVVAGVRAYNTREQLRLSHSSLLKYVENGGTYIVQYQVLERGQTDNLGPFPIEVSRNRVTDEQSPIQFLKPAHRLLNVPNKISADDFNGWVQERGLYFPSQWDSKYETVIACADPKESPQNSSILYAKHGKGHYLFTGLSFFRQMPAGVEGAYRLFANMLSVGKE